MDYKDRMVIEYNELKERYVKLRKMLAASCAGKLDFVPSCPIGLLRDQLKAMDEYMFILESRAIIEDIDL